MPTGFTRPSLTTIQQNVLNNINANLPNYDARLRFSPLYIFGNALSGNLHNVYAEIDWSYQQSFITTCLGSKLDEYGVIFGLPRLQSSVSTGIATFTNTGSSYSLPAGTTLTAGNGNTYTTNTTTTIAVGSTTVAFTSTGKGSIQNLLSGTVLSYTGKPNTVSITGTSTGGRDLETDEEYRARLLIKISAPTLSGSLNDIKTQMLASTTPTCSRAWVDNSYPGVLFCYFLAGGGSIPTSTDITNMQNYLNNLKPVCTAVYVSAPLTNTINFTINISPDTTDLRSKVNNAITNAFLTHADIGKALYLSQIHDFITQVDGLDHYTISSPSVDIPAVGQTLPVFGSITWV